MRNKNYSDTPLRVRLHTLQEETLDKIMDDREFCNRKNIISKWTLCALHYFLYAKTTNKQNIIN